MNIGQVWLRALRVLEQRTPVASGESRPEEDAGDQALRVRATAATALHPEARGNGTSPLLIRQRVERPDDDEHGREAGQGDHREK